MAVTFSLFFPPISIGRGELANVAFYARSSRTSLTVHSQTFASGDHTAQRNKNNLGHQRHTTTTGHLGPLCLDVAISHHYEQRVLRVDDDGDYPAWTPDARAIASAPTSP